MARSKKIFLVLAAIFMILMAVIGYDIARRTAFPGSNKDQTEHSTSESSDRDSTGLTPKDKK
jgi:hypothetical protein